jgi:lipopolysaccharide/colanic/teichoic acid biosynthesis glycosyltransferase
MARESQITDSATAVHQPTAATPFLTSKSKRVFDIVLGLFGVSLTLITFPIVALIIKLDSRGPIFYRQVRLGINGREFKIFKYRTMIHNAESESGAVWATHDDPRMTRIGKLFRKLYVDEFPQWWNVLVGEMSVVGPRPERPEMNSKITQDLPQFTFRLRAKPGITGLAQTEYKYANSVSGSRHKLNYDQIYIAKASIALDLWVVLRTFRRMLLRRGT